ncbi:hypothetical protein [Cyclobacterium marinum]|uniref:hypothetical protein n=1 Tax=Cyclobacterium marinum TaxID=104 RepID=UPI0011EC4505|nr:hypothetical protein [Cyclobacterium marinum]MBI0397342.1 hypothetical protein [Cyclobacterium marinum]
MKKSIYINSTIYKKILLGMTLLFSLSCNLDNEDHFINQEIGNVWLSGGLANCAEQIHLNNGDTLIVNLGDIITFTSGDKVSVKYKEIGINESCSPSINCEIVEIKKVE